MNKEKAHKMIKKYRALERKHKDAIEMADKDHKNHIITKEKYNKIKTKHEKEIEKLLPKIKELREILHDKKGE